MPELPEVETIRRQLEPWLTGKTITRIEVPDPLVTEPASPASFIKRLRGRIIETVGRHGKYLLFNLDSGDILVIHLRMTGILTQISQPLTQEQNRHLRLLLRFSDGTALAFHDARRFGKAFVLSQKTAAVYWKKLGPEPLGRSFNRSHLKSVLEKRQRPIKSLLLDQKFIAGIGNIYADEALFRARIHPSRPSGDLDEDEIKELTNSIKETLRKAIRLEGSSIDTYRDSRGRRGRFQETFSVHRRQGEACPVCKKSIEKIKVGGRGTYFCPRCQR